MSTADDAWCHERAASLDAALVPGAYDLDAAHWDEVAVCAYCGVRGCPRCQVPDDTWAAAFVAAVEQARGYREAS